MKLTLATGLLFVLFSSIVFATTVSTDYSGNGDFQLQTSIQSEVVPSIDDSATIHTGCNGGCCCCPDCSGSYEGYQIVTNSPFSISVDEARVTNGCVALEQRIDDSFNSRRAETNYYTYLDGSGVATSYIYAKPGQGNSYQLSNGTGSTFVSFDQVFFSNGDFDYGTTYGGGAYLCDYGYTGMVNSYDLLNHKSYYSPELGSYCYPVNEDSSIYAFLFAKTTGSFNLEDKLKVDSVEMKENIEAEGASEYGTVFNSHKNIDFDFGMELG